MHEIFGTIKTEAVLLFDAENAFSSINRQVFLHNIKHIYPPIATFVRICYNVPARLFVVGGKEFLSHEDTTQEDPTAMAIYGIALAPLLKYLAICYPERDPQMVAFADDLTSAGRLSKLRSWWKVLLDVGPKYGYFSKPCKTILIVKPEYKPKTLEVFDNTKMKITSSGQKHLGAVIRSELYQKEYIEEIVSKWRDELLLLSNITEIQPQAAYSAYIHGFKSKYNFFSSTIPTMQNHMKIIEDVFRNHFISAIIGESSISDHLRQLIVLPIRLGGIAVTTPHLNTEAEHKASRLLTKDIVDDIISQSTEYKPNKERISEIKNNIKKEKTKAENANLSRIRENMSTDQIRANDILQQPGCNNWLNIIPTE